MPPPRSTAATTITATTTTTIATILRVLDRRPPLGTDISNHLLRRNGTFVPRSGRRSLWSGRRPAGQAQATRAGARPVSSGRLVVPVELQRRVDRRGHRVSHDRADGEVDPAGRVLVLLVDRDVLPVGITVELVDTPTGLDGRWRISETEFGSDVLVRSRSPRRATVMTPVRTLCREAHGRLGGSGGSCHGGGWELRTATLTALGLRARRAFAEASAIRWKCARFAQSARRRRSASARIAPSITTHSLIPHDGPEWHGPRQRLRGGGLEPLADLCVNRVSAVPAATTAGRCLR